MGQALASQSRDGRSRRVVIFNLITIAAVFLAACSPSHTNAAQRDPLRAVSAGSSVDEAYAFYAPPRTTVSIQLNVGLCADQPITIDRLIPHVTLRHNLRLVGWGIDNRSTFTAHVAVNGSLSALGDYARHRVTLSCPPATDHFAPVAHIGVELIRTTVEAASVAGFDLLYRSNGDRKELRLFVPLALCGSRLPSCEVLR